MSSSPWFLRFLPQTYSAPFHNFTTHTIAAFSQCWMVCQTTRPVIQEIYDSSRHCALHDRCQQERLKFSDFSSAVVWLNQLEPWLKAAKASTDISLWLCMSLMNYGYGLNGAWILKEQLVGKQTLKHKKCIHSVYHDRWQCHKTTPTFCLFRSNILDTGDDSYLKNCSYDEDHSPYCPIFRLGDLVSRAGHNFEEMAVLVSELGFIQFNRRIVMYLAT